MKRLDKTARVFLYLLLSVVTVIFPFLGLLLFAVLYFFADTKKSIVFLSIMLGVLVGFFAYNFTPANNYDLVRHQSIVEKYETVDDISSFVAVYNSSNREPLPQLYSYLISRTGNSNLLQFFVVTIGYSALFYILADYKKRVGLSNANFVPIFILILFGQHTLYYFSGLYNYVAINLFALAFYLDYFHEKRAIPYMIYISTFFIHTSMVLPLMILLLFKLNKNRLSKRLYFFSAITVLIGLLLLLNTGGVEGGGFDTLRMMFNGYSSNNAYYLRFYNGFGLVVDILKIILVFLSYRVTKNVQELKSTRAFVVLALPIIIVLLPISIVLIRFVTLFFFISIPMLISAVKTHSGNIKLLFLAYIICAFIFASYNIYTVYPYGYKSFFIKKIPSTTTNFLHKGGLDD